MMGGAGELLIQLSPPRLFTRSLPWAAPSVDVSITIPAWSGLVGLDFYVQGAFLAPGSPGESVRLTGGIAAEIGGYL